MSTTSYLLARQCSRCPSRITDQNNAGICRRCLCRSYHDLPNRRTPETEARRIAALVEANRRRVYLPWCPNEYRKVYRNMVSNRRFKASEARAIILAQIAADKARRKTTLSPFERQERALARGAKLIANDRGPSFGEAVDYGEAKWERLAG